mmetsp:Transcript_11403/g.30749  ORF Transcript_11403/g.30749 Transcript_11403/m.30749 type:complete len:210 (-) Transcript_11403:312-941(-)
MDLQARDRGGGFGALFGHREVAPLPLRAFPELHEAATGGVLALRGVLDPLLEGLHLRPQLLARTLCNSQALRAAPRLVIPGGHCLIHLRPQSFRLLMPGGHCLLHLNPQGLHLLPNLLRAPGAGGELCAEAASLDLCQVELCDVSLALEPGLLDFGPEVLGLPAVAAGRGLGDLRAAGLLGVGLLEAIDLQQEPHCLLLRPFHARVAAS